MRPPPDQLLDIRGTRTDLPARAQPRYGIGTLHVFAVATLLGLLSTTLAWQFTRFFGKWSTPLSSLVILNFTWWYVWALMAPAVIWLAQHFQVARGGLLLAVVVHVPAAIVFSFLHIAGMQGVHWWLARYAGQDYGWWAQVERSAFLYLDWEMMTYWAIVGISHALLYYRESREREVRAAQLETRLVAAQLTTLQQQLHPHFLFNTLHAISSLMHRDVNAADRVLVQLSDLLRLTLEHLGQQEVPLGAELDALEKYVDIERTRFADRLVVRFDIQPDTLDTLVPSLLLQPLVENAIKYGVARKAGPGHIDISRAPRRRQAAARGQGRRDRVDRGCPDGTAQGHRRVDDPRPPPASLRRRLPLRVPSPDAGARHRRRAAMAPGRRRRRRHQLCSRRLVQRARDRHRWPEPGDRRPCPASPTW